MIKVLAISHAYVEPFTRSGLVEKEGFPDIDLTVCVPSALPEKNEEGFKNLVNEGYKVYPLKSFLNFHQSLRFYGLGLLSLIKRVKPDIIFINNEPWSLTAFQTAVFTGFLKPKPKIAVYTCENLRRNYYFFFKLLERYVLRRADLMLTLSKDDGKKILIGKGFKKGIVYLPLSADTSRFIKQDASALKKSLLRDTEGKFVIGFAGRIVKEKGLDTLIDALSFLPGSCRLLIIGSGPYKQKLTEKCKKMGLESKILFIGNIPNSELPGYLNCMDVFVLPSLTTPNWKEQFGRVLIEAMSCEVPVIGSDSGEIPEVIGSSGLTFPEGTQEVWRIK